MNYCQYRRGIENTAIDIESDPKALLAEWCGLTRYVFEVPDDFSVETLRTHFPDPPYEQGVILDWLRDHYTLIVEGGDDNVASALGVQLELVP